MRHSLIGAKLGVLAGLALLGGCATFDTRWDTCEKAGGPFVAVADCTVRGLQGDASRWSQPALRARSETRARRYALKAEELMQNVASGRTADADARLALRRAYEQVLDEERDDRLTPLRQPQKTGVTCSPAGGSVSCTAN